MDLISGEFRIFEMPQILSQLRLQLHSFISYTKILSDLDKLCLKYKVFNQEQFLLNHYSDELILWISGLTKKMNGLIFGEIKQLFDVFEAGFGDQGKDEFGEEYKEIVKEALRDNVRFGFESKRNVLGKEFKDSFIKKIENLIFTILIKNQPISEDQGKISELNTLENLLRKQIESEIENIEIVDQEQRASLSLRYRSPTPQKKLKKIEKIIKVPEPKKKIFSIEEWSKDIKFEIEELPAPALDLHGIVNLLLIFLRISLILENLTP